jgi:ABC-type amino acid transport system permease subunit
MARTGLYKSEVKKARDSLLALGRQSDMFLIKTLSVGFIEFIRGVPLYATLPSVQEILLVDSSKVEAMLLRRGADENWPQEPHTIEPGGVIALASIGLEVTLAEVYRDTHLASPQRT